MVDVRVPTLDGNDKILDKFFPNGPLPAASNDGYVLTAASGDWVAAPPIGADVAVSADPDNYATTGSDGGVFVPQSQPPGNYVESDDPRLKYLAPIWVLEADEDENDIPGDFPTAPLVTGGPPPIVLRKKA